MRRSVLLVLAVALALAGASGGASAQSTASAQSLLITPGARADGMGRAYIALADDATSVWWNPGGLAFTAYRSATLMHTKLVPGLADDVYYEYLGYSQPLQGVGGIGGNIIYLTYGKSTAVTDEEEVLGEFSSYEVAATGALGFSVTPSIGFGAALKAVYVSLAPKWATPDAEGAGNASSFAVDLGALYQRASPFLSSDQLNLALVVTNLGPDLTFIDEGQSSPLGRIVKLGLMYQVFDSGQYALRFTYDYNQPVIVSEGGTSFFDRFTDFKRPLFRSAEEPIQNMGGELGIVQGNVHAAARIGYIYDPEGTIDDFTFGLGFGLGALNIDWGKVPQSRYLEDNVNKFSLTARF